MHTSATLYDEAISLARLEELALEEEDIDRAEELADRRADLLFDAWRLRGAGELLVEQLQTLQSIQQHLQERATRLRDKLGGQIAAERKQSKYFNGYRHDQAQRQKAFYCDTHS
jgi:hypothetical protein